MRGIAEKKDVEAIAPVFPMKLITPISIETDTSFHSDSDDASSMKPSTWGIEAVGANTSPFSGEDVIVAVLDTGIDHMHPSFADVELIRRNFTNEEDGDIDGHGTHCAGTIFGRAISGTRIGIAQGVKTALIGKVLGEGGGGSDVVLSAIEWALLNGAHVISMSLGIDFPGYVAELVEHDVPAALATSMALEGYRANINLFERLSALIQTRSAFMQASMLVAAAGNESRRNESPDFKIAVSPPAAAEGIISVAAVGKDTEGYTIAPFSNFGARISAPGVNVLSAKKGGGLITMSGTSMAAPHVAGVAALWAHKLLSLSQFRGQLFIDRLVGSGTLAGMRSGFDPADVGVGIVQAPQN